ncbi:hypothetical protein [Alloalcanivorax xenomutans]|uniref:hypothetical protein n=1 Tax=Alloalcanivorax xenomutans TaxID=1094342 RepID=UPI0012DEB7D7
MDLVYRLRVSLNVLSDERLPETFSIDVGHRFRAYFNGIYHPAQVDAIDKVLHIGESGGAEISIICMPEEEWQVFPGLAIDFVGGVDIEVGWGEVIAVLEKIED